LLAALGFDQRRARHLLGTEGLMVALIGATLGVGLGVAYAWLLVKGLTTLWVAAVAIPSLELKVELNSLAIGLARGWGLAALSTRRSLTQWLRQAPYGLLKGSASSGQWPAAVSRRRRTWL